MPRIPRVVVPGVPHHVTQRANRGAVVFDGDASRRRYLGLLRGYGKCHGLAIVAYCLMPNHVHLIAIPEKEDSLAHTLKPVHQRYAQELNRRKGEPGLVWQGRFYSCPMDEDHHWAAVRYVERNPVRAKMVARAEDYAWSSARAHCGLVRDDLLTKLAGRPVPEADWTVWLEDDEDPVVVDVLRRRTRTGRPAGSTSFVDRLEGSLQRVLRGRPAGRPPKAENRGR